MVAFIGKGFDGSMYEYSSGSEADLVPGPVATVKNSLGDRLGR